MRLFNINRTNNNNNNSNIPPTNMSFYKKNLTRITQSNTVIVSAVKPEVVVAAAAAAAGAAGSKSRWGPSIWFLFHTLAHKIKPEEFGRIKVELLDIIKSICVNLPCPSCAQHAGEYMQRVNYASIQSKEDLKLFLFNFHNDVNRRKNVPPFPLSDLDTKYAAANTVNIINNFMAVFQYKNKGFHMIANDMQRQRQADMLKGWFVNNINSFS